MGDARIGLIGLGTMGAALAANIAEKGFPIAVYNRTTQVTRDFAASCAEVGAPVTACETLTELVSAIAKPRAIILMVPAGETVDEQIDALREHLDADDLIIDAGNANFHDTNRREDAATGPFMGIGVSGGEEGARHGPSIMAGGAAKEWEQVKDILLAISAKHEGDPCAALMGPGGAGHFVKMVHNGIEYADMQMIAEIYGILRDGHGMEPDAIGEVFEGWNDGPLQSYLVEITGIVSKAKDTATGDPLLSVIVDAAGQKGTGRWTAIESQHRLAPVPAIEAAVVARSLSSRLKERAATQDVFGAAPGRFDSLDHATLERALIAGKVLCYAQGFEMLSAAARDFDWDLPMSRIAEIWRAGCIIRSSMLDEMAKALDAEPGENLMRTDHFAAILKDSHAALRKVVAEATLNGHPVPALASGIAYFDAMRTARGTANMVQAQRDYFGLHGFVHVNGKEGQHGPWAEKP
ncbi:MAG: NADP-dependent phosphogluconate dehydrogenase [Pseudomonadota bacterium]